jgi:Spy/CpxP family protein refolding chaperone
MTVSLARSAGLAALSLALGLGYAPASTAKGPMGPGVERAVEALDLDAETRKQALAVIDAARPTGRELRESLRSAHEELRSLLDQPDPAEDAVLALADRIGTLRTELQKHDLRTLLQVRATLSPEQREQLAEEIRKHPHGPRHGRGPRVL